MAPTFYRGCWHVVSRALFWGYCPSSSPQKALYDPKTFFAHAALLHQAFAHCAIFPTAATRRCLARVSVPVWGVTLRPPTRLRLGKPLPYQLADGTQAPPKAGRSCERTPFVSKPLASKTSCGISRPFDLLSHASGQVTNALLTRSPLSIYRYILRSTCMY